MPRYLGSWLDETLQSTASLVTIGGVVYVAILAIGGIAALGTPVFVVFAPFSFVVAFLIVTVLSIPLVAGLLLGIRWVARLGEPARLERELKRQAELALVRRFAAWDPVNDFTLREAACLWNDEDPVPLADLIKDFVDTQGRAKAIETQLLRAVEDGRLKKKSIGSGGPYIQLTRADLVAYAINTDQRPGFLFPDARPGGSPMIMRSVRGSHR